MLTRFSHQEETDRPPGRSLLWSRRSARCCSPAGCLPQNASCPLDQPEQRDRQTHSRVSVYPNEKTYRRLEKATPPRPPLPWPGRKKTAKWFNVLWVEIECVVERRLTSVGAGLLERRVCGWASDISDSFSSSSSWMGEEGDRRVLQKRKELYSW